MNNEQDLLEDDFVEQAQRTQTKLAILGFILFLTGFFVVAGIIYFFLELAGVVPL